VPYKGLLYADPVTGGLIRLALTCVDIPLDSDYTGVEVTLDFRSFDIAGRSVDLPAHSLVHLQMIGGQATNEADYRSYRLASFQHQC
jgi:hypothetical protein